MSRTFRRKRGDQFMLWFYTRNAPNKSSAEYKRGYAMFHSDNANCSFKEPGPSWFRNMFSQRPLRARARAEIHKYLVNPEYEVVLDYNPPLPYWT